MFTPAHSLTVDNAAVALEAGLQAIAGGQAEIDLAALTVVDSAGVATLLAWLRAARERNLSLRLCNLPAGLRMLAELYGVSNLLYSVTNAAAA